MSTIRRKQFDKVSWDPDALYWATMYGLTTEAVESVVFHPAQSAIDPRTAEVDYTVLRHRTGDVLVVVGYLHEDEPRILFVTTLTGQEQTKGSKGGGGSGSMLPKSITDMRRRVLALGYEITLENHPKIKTGDGRVIGSVPGTPSDIRSIPNAWRQFCRAHASEIIRSKS